MPKKNESYILLSFHSSIIGNSPEAKVIVVQSVDWRVGGVWPVCTVECCQARKRTEVVHMESLDNIVLRESVIEQQAVCGLETSRVGLAFLCDKVSLAHVGLELALAQASLQL